MTVRALITGATGFIGSHMAELLLAEGWEIVCPVRNTRILGHLTGVQVQVVPLDAVPHLIRMEPSFDYVFHVAGAVHGSDYVLFRKANVQLTESLLDLFSKSRSRNSLKRFVLVSSQSAGGPSPIDGSPLAEYDVARPVSLYGRSKLEAERVALDYANSIPITIIRPSTVFGPRDSNVLLFFRAARYGLALYMWGPDRLVSLIFVEDLVRGILAAALSLQSVGETYFMANPEPLIWRQFCFDVCQTLGHRALPLPLPISVWKCIAFGGDILGKLTGSPSVLCYDKLRDVMQPAWVCSVEKARDQLGWEPDTPLDEALLRTVQWYREQGLL